MSNPNPIDPPGRTCHCSGSCGPQTRVLSRRQFLQMMAAGTTAAAVAAPAWGAFNLAPNELQRWRGELFSPAQPRRYSSETHTDARMHLGGIGTGNFEIGADGQLTTWQLFNTLRDGNVPLHFLVKAGSSVKLLQTKGGPEWPRVNRIEMTGEYPLAGLRFFDSELPVELELSAFTPFVPLDAAMSAMPVAAFIFRIRNWSGQSHEVSLAALMQNPVGYEAGGENLGLSNACFGGNVNEILHQGSLAGVFMRADPMPEPTLDIPVTIYTGANLKDLLSPPADHPANLTVEIMENGPVPAGKPGETGRRIIWFEDAPASLRPETLNSLRTAIQAGATLVFAGRSQPLLQTYGSWTGGKTVEAGHSRPDILFEDFENGYGKWEVTGDAFGQEPARGTLPNQQRVSGFLGHGLVNSFLGGDDPKGRLVSKPFQVTRRFIRFLVGGGDYAETQVRLLVNGQVARAISGKDNERLEPATWDVIEFEGQTAHLEIVDDRAGGWGHINVDQIEFSDLPGSRDLMLVLEELLPARFSGVRPRSDSALESGRVQFENLELHSTATQTTAENGLILLSRPVGKGRVVVAAGAVLDPADATLSSPRQRAYAFLCALAGAHYSSVRGIHPKAPGFGSLALITTGRDPSIFSASQDWNAAWELFRSKGRFAPASQARANEPTPPGRTVCGGVAASVKVPAGGSVEIPFLLAWHYPNKYAGNKQWIGCHYTTQWPDARAAVVEAAGQIKSWRARTERFRSVFYDSTLPYWLLDCLTANAAIMRHIGVVFRTGNGDVYGWEGSNGCCDPTCTHVWGYEQSFARLFPDLEKEMRRIDFKHQQRPDGGVNNRTAVPSPPHPSGEQPFADGHASCILKAYREALNHTDEGFFQEYWPAVKRGVEYLISRDATAAGGTPSGVLQDDQWNTYDEALHGVTSFITGYYLAALRAGEEWARRVGEPATADRFQEVFRKGQTRLVELCWNGEYFQQHLTDYLQRPGEVGPGCMSDQLIGQWWAHQLGLGYLLPRDKVTSALKAVFKYNFKSDLTEWKHSPRAFAGAKDKGLIICTWPRGGRPANVMLYSDEVWTGIEYQVAAHLIYEGMIEEGLAVVKGARERYDGIPRPPIQRNPWSEIECGGHYARAMSSWSLLLAISGWEYDAPRGVLRFTPRHSKEDFSSFFSGPAGWGSARQSRRGRHQTNELRVDEGQVVLTELRLETLNAPTGVRAELAGKRIKSAFTFTDGTLRVSLLGPVVLRAGQSLRLQMLA